MVQYGRIIRSGIVALAAAGAFYGITRIPDKEVRIGVGTVGILATGIALGKYIKKETQDMDKERKERKDEARKAKGGDITLYIDGKKVPKEEMHKYLPRSHIK